MSDPVDVPLGEGHVAVDLPDCTVDVARPAGGEAVDPAVATERALDDPNGPSLSALVDPDDTVAVVVTDLTRATPDEALLAPLLDRLGRLGVVREQVTVVVGLGLHRPMTDEELDAMLGEFAPLAVNHDPDDTVVAGEVDGVPVELHRTVAAADHVLSTGMVEPHQYAGFSGGAKTVVVGAGGEPLIRYTHGPDMLSRDGVRLGRVADNPFREFLDRAGDVAGVEFCLNVTRGPQGVLGVAAGDPRAVVRELAATAREALAVEVEEGYDAVVAGVGAPKDATLYQATRAATYVVLGAANPLREGGRVVVPARLQEGAGDGRGEQRFFDRLSGATDAGTLYEEMREGYEPGAQRAFVVARALRDHPLVVTDSEAPDVVERCLMRAEEGVADAVDPGSRVLVVPDALNTLLV
ncbi:lactate racemase domain-containing protein [Halomarina rubra]|uniref:Lactate racemase domain-containing protein n=1 Tax=Halomarina rubra TaxID=2071873 RepID=A0ABD6AZA6_9EURY|nr:lactate racemase domain-containing protein [Halomarina rubra]